jgi:hypothetical protein
MKVANAIIVLIHILVDGPSSTSSTYADALSFGGIAPPLAATAATGTLPRGGGGGARIRSSDHRRTAAVPTRANAAASIVTDNNDDDDDDAPLASDGKSTISSAAFNLIKGAVGSGVLSLPAGVAAYGDVKRA